MSVPRKNIFIPHYYIRK